LCFVSKIGVYVVKQKLLITAYGILVLMTTVWGESPADNRSGQHEGLHRWLASDAIAVPDPVETLDDLIPLMVQRNPDIQAAVADYRRAQMLENTNIRLPDPTLTVGLFGQPIETANGPQQMKVAISQRIPLPAKTKAGRDQLSAATAMAEQSLFSLYLQKLRDLRSLWNEVWALHQRIQLQEKKLALIRENIDILDTKYRGGLVPHALFIQTQINMKLLENSLVGMRKEKHRLEIRLGRLVGLDTPFKMNEPPQLNMEPPALALVVSQNPSWKRLQKLEEGSAASERLAKAKYFPDLSIGLEYLAIGPKEGAGSSSATSGQDALAFSIGTQIPLWNWKQKRAALRASQQQKVHAAFQLESEADRLQEAYALARSAWEENLRYVSVYNNELIPLSREKAEVTQRAYITENASISEFILAQQEVLDLRIALVNLQKAGNQALIEMLYLRSE
jgi:outer membrane protein TolC